MQTSDLLAVIAAAIALSAYLSTVRFRLLDKGRKGYAKALMVADVPLVVSGTTLAVCVGLKTYLGWSCENGIDVGLGFFALALIALIGFHIYEWGISLEA
jgi:hypothetical protein